MMLLLVFTMTMMINYWCNEVLALCIVDAEDDCDNYWSDEVLAFGASRDKLLLVTLVAVQPVLPAYDDDDDDNYDDDCWESRDWRHQQIAQNECWVSPPTPVGNEKVNVKFSVFCEPDKFKGTGSFWTQST